MKIADLALLRVPSDPTVSPDGTHAVVTVTGMDLDADDYRSHLWIVATDGTSAPRRLTNGPRDRHPLYSPDGRWIAFLRNAGDADKPQLHVLPTDGGDPRQLTDHPLGVDTPAWSPDSTRLVYVARVPEDGRYRSEVSPAKEPPRRITTRKYRLDGVGYTIDKRPQVFTVAVAGHEEPRQLTDGDYDHADPVWSPDGRRIAFAAARHDGRHSDLISDIHLMSPDGGDIKTVTDTTLSARRPVFVDDERLVFLAETVPDMAARNTRLWRVDLRTAATPRPLTDADRWNLDSYGSGSRQPLLVGADTVATLHQNGGALELVRVPLDGGEPVVAVSGHRQVTGAAGNGDVTVMIVATDTSAGELVRLDDEGETVLTSFGAVLSETGDLLPLTPLETTAPDGYPVRGWVVTPPGDGPFPVVLSIHGGPFTQYGWTLFDEAQIYAGAGYAVVLGNPRGASGLGEAHGRAIIGDLGNLDRADLLALLDAALDDPALANDRVGVMGGSYGGLMTTWLAGTDGHRFRAAISERAVNAWDSFTGSSDIGWEFPNSYCGPDPDRQRAQSPLTYADGITIPMLIIHSEEDWRCPLEQAQRLFERLQRNGVPSEMLIFPGEGHELSRSGLPSHRVARFEAILEWWDRHL